MTTERRQIYLLQHRHCGGWGYGPAGTEAMVGAGGVNDHRFDLTIYGSGQLALDMYDSALKTSYGEVSAIKTRSESKAGQRERT